VTPSAILVALVAMAAVAYVIGRSRAVAFSASDLKPHSLAGYHGGYAALYAVLPSLALFALCLVLEPVLLRSLVVGGLPAEYQTLSEPELGLVYNDIRNLVDGNIVAGEPSAEIRAAADSYAAFRDLGRWIGGIGIVVVSIAALGAALRRLRPEFRARNSVETSVERLLMVASTIAIFTTIGIFLSVLFESLRFFQQVSPIEFLFGLEWSPQTAIREDQIGSSGSFGAVPLFVGTLLISALAMLVAVPLGLMSAIYLSEYAAPTVRAYVKPLLEVLAGIPTVVYGYFAALTVSPAIRTLGSTLGLDASSESALGAGLVMGIMIIPFVSSLSDDVINAVPQSLRDGSFGLGATKSETIRHVILPAALPGIVGGILLAVSRAIGETMIVVMAAGLAANLTINPLEAVTTVTVQIVTLLVGDQEFDSAKTLSAFALGLMLFLTTLALNVIALSVVRRYREQYD